MNSRKQLLLDIAATEKKLQWLERDASDHKHGLIEWLNKNRWLSLVALLPVVWVGWQALKKKPFTRMATQVKKRFNKLPYFILNMILDYWVLKNKSRLFPSKKNAILSS